MGWPRRSGCTCGICRACRSSPSWPRASARSSSSRRRRHAPASRPAQMMGRLAVGIEHRQGVSTERPEPLRSPPVRDYYEELWERLPEQLEPPDLELRAAFARANVRAGDRVLDLGCGDGALTGVLAEAAGAGGVPGESVAEARRPARPSGRSAADGSVIGVDVAEAALRRARARHPALTFALAADRRRVAVRGRVVRRRLGQRGDRARRRHGALAVGSEARARAARAAAADDAEPRQAAAGDRRDRALLRAARGSSSPLQRPIAARAADRVRLHGDRAPRRRWATAAQAAVVSRRRVR